MNKKTLISFIVVIAVVVVGVFFLTRNTDVVPTLPSEDPTVFDGKNTHFTIEGNEVVLVQGISEVSVQGSASKTTTRYFGNEAKGDLNGDSLEDVAFLITEDLGGSGLFYYAVVALKNPTGYKTTNAFLVGDRIAPQSTEIHTDSKELHVNFAERKVGEPMTAQPSVGAVLLLKVTSEGVLEGLMK
ncbi:MAG: hypothetical protein WC880_02215 [Candidatus Paceibacterota bacterium]